MAKILIFFSPRSKKLNATNLTVIRSTVKEQFAKEHWSSELTGPLERGLNNINFHLCFVQAL